MNLKVYRKTRYQNIYQHIKNKNYMIMISKPVKSSISRINGEKIWKLEEAVKIRDNPKIKLQKSAEVKYKDNFDELWEKYMYNCLHIKKLAYNTYLKKQRIYSKHLKDNLNIRISKLTKEKIIKFIDDLDTTIKQKNEIIRQLKAFFNWCVEEELLILNPMEKIIKFKVTKPQMKFWLPQDFVKFSNYLNDKIDNTNNLNQKEVLYRLKTFVTISFALGDRVGETRALTFKNFNKEQLKISINHSINYDTKSKDFLSNTKTYSSQREIDITSKLIEEVERFKYFLQNELNYNINDDTLLFLNHTTNKPYTDTTIRKSFYKICDEINLPRIRLYDLRHTYVATMMAEGKELYLISERLGHTSFSTTVNKYGHLSNQIRKEIAEVTDKYL